MVERLRSLLRQTPDGAPLNFGMGILALAVGLLRDQPALMLLGVCYALAFSTVALRWRWARVVLMILFLFMGARLLANAFWFGPNLIRLAGSGFCLWMAMDVWRRYSPENLGAVLDQPCALVLLRAQPRQLEGEEVARLLGETWGGTFAFDQAPTDSEAEAADEEEDSEEAVRQFVVGKEGHFMIHARRGWFLMHNVSAPYWNDDTDSVAEMYADLRFAKAVRDHQAWLSIDLLRVGQSEDEQVLQLRAMGKLIAVLADANTMAIFRPDHGELNIWSEQCQDHLERGQVDDALAELSEPPVIGIGDDNEDLIKGTAEAKRRWPEFVTAYAGQDQACDSFAVKAPVTRHEVTEFIWLEITKLEAGRVHGTLQNDPVNLDDLKLGDQVEVAEIDVNDWVYSLGNEPPVGLFTLAVFNSAEEA